jgi:hypothetical protein
MSLSRGFTRLLKKGAATKPENQDTQKDRQTQKRCAFDAPDDTRNRRNESVFHYFFLLQFNNRGLLSSRGYSLNITHPANAITSEAKTIISVGRQTVNAKSRAAMAVLEQVDEKGVLYL